MSTARLLVPALLVLASAASTTSPLAAEDRPNILWITSEDNGPELGCYGDDYADTPHLDALAAQGLRYHTCWSDAPVCAPARTAIITGMYPNSLGAEHMRSFVPLPPGAVTYPELMRQAGYYCTNNSKTDYNLSGLGSIWDESSRQAHWRNRPDESQPFFAIFNITTSHESQIRRRPHTLVHDPAEAPIPAYHPDTPEVRRDWAQYYDIVTEMDREVGERLRELEEAGLADDTIVFYYGDHGSGMPRSKRWPYSSGLRVPLILRVPPKYAHLAPSDYQAGGLSERLVGFVDLAPTLLSLAGVAPPERMQGRAVMGPHEAEPRRYLFGFRGRMDDRIDLVRSVGDGRYVYIRNFMPHRIYGQHVAYMFETPTTRIWHQMFERGELNEVQSRFWQTKPVEELYDLENDPDEVVNLAEDPQHAERLAAMREAMRQWMHEIRDVGLLPEGEMHRRAGAEAPYTLAHDEQRYPLRRILETAERASDRRSDSLPPLAQAARDEDSGVRYWAIVGLTTRGAEEVSAHRHLLEEALKDPSPSVAIAAAEGVARDLDGAARQAALDRLLEAADLRHSTLYDAIAALGAIDLLGPIAQPILPDVDQLPRTRDDIPNRLGAYVGRLLDHIGEPEGR